MPSATTMMIIECIKSIPRGKVASYGGVAEMAGIPAGGSGARQVARILSSMSKSWGLPWWRIVRKDGRIAFGPGESRDLQRQLLETENVVFSEPDRVDMTRSGLR